MNIQLDIDLFKTKVFHGLKSLQCIGDTLEPRYLEIVICESFGFKHVGDSSYYADGIKNDNQISVKTRMINPHVLKTKEGRDFQSNPEKFLGPQVNQKLNKWTAGLEIVQRRQKLDSINDSTEEPETIGKETLEKFLLNINESHAKYQTCNTYEIIGVHGYDPTKKYYLVSLFWKEYQPLDYSKIQWLREGYGVSGYSTINGVQQKICERVNGNAKREATCFKEYKNLIEYNCSVNIKLPLPEPWKFDKNAILEELNLKEEKLNGSDLFHK